MVVVVVMSLVPRPRCWVLQQCRFSQEWLIPCSRGRAIRSCTADDVDHSRTSGFGGVDVGGGDCAGDDIWGSGIYVPVGRFARLLIRSCRYSRSRRSSGEDHLRNSATSLVSNSRRRLPTRSSSIVPDSSMRAMSRSSNAFHDSSMRAFRRCSIASRCCLSSLSNVYLFFLA